MKLSQLLSEQYRALHKSFRERLVTGGDPLSESYPTFDGGALAVIGRGRNVEEVLIRRPNLVSTVITRLSGEIIVNPIATNIRTTVGADWQSDAMGGFTRATATQMYGTSSVAPTATLLTDSAKAWTVDEFKGSIVVADTGTGAPLFGNVLSNTATALTIDGWWGDPNAVAGTTPAAVNTGYYIIPGAGAAKYVGLTNDATAPAAGDTVLATELVANGGERAWGTYAHTNGVTSYTLQKQFTASGAGFSAQKSGLFTSKTGAGVMAFTAAFTPATLAAGDTLTLTWTLNL